MKLGMNPIARAVAQALAALAVAGCGGGANDGPTGQQSEGAAEARSAQAASASAWTLIASEGEPFSVSSTQTVRYGSGSSWIQRSISGSGECSNTFFGSDPLYGAVKQCEQLTVSDGSTSTSTATTSTSTTTGSTTPTAVQGESTVAVAYSLPAAGQAVAIGTNTAAEIKPSAITPLNWAYSLFNSYGSGSFNPDFSPAGAYVVSGTGGHNAPPNVDAAVFDFTTASWKLISNTNGVAPRNTDFSTSEVSNDDYREILGVTNGRVPAPSHVYSLTGYLPASMGGGPKGSFVKIGQIGATPSAAFGRSLHRMDLSTGLWSRLTNDLVDWMWSAEGSTVFDPVAKRFYVVPESFHRANYLQYFDVSSASVKLTPTYPSPADYTASGYQTTWLDPVRRLILNQRPGWPLRALDLNNIANGWVVLNTTGRQPDVANRWAFFEPDGRFYTRGNSSGQVLNRLTPPANWKTDTWVYDTVSVSGATLPDFTNTGGNSTRHYGTFFYVPAIQSLAWISGESTKVVILKPPAN